MKPDVPSSPRSASRAGARLGRVAAALAALLVCLVGAPVPASAQPYVIADPTVAKDAQDDVQQAAASVALLVRSSLEPGPRTMVPLRQVALALEAATGHTPESHLAVSAALVPKLAEQLGADAFLIWALQAGPKGPVVGGTLIGPTGKRLLRISASAASGDVAELARQVARRLATALGLTVRPTPDLGLADVRPFVQAEVALLAQDTVAVTRSLDLALPRAAAALAGAKTVLDDIAADPGLSPLPRAQASLLLGHWDEALERAEVGLAESKSDGKNVALRVIKVRALAARKAFDAAEREIAMLKPAHTPAQLVLAQVALGIARGDSPDQLAATLSPLFGRPAQEWRPVLPLIASSPPGSFGARGEAAALAAAEKLAQQEPGLASTLAARALLGGAKVQQTAPLINVSDLSTAQAAAVGRHIADDSSTGAAALGQRIKAREEDAKQIAAAATAGPDRPSGPPTVLAANLRTVLQDFDALYDPKLSEIQIAPLPGSGQPFYWPFLIRRQRLSEGLLEALMRSPWELRAKVAKTPTDALPAARFSEEGMATLAHELGGSVLFYRIRPSGLAPWATVELLLFDSARQKLDKIEASMVGRSTGLMGPSPLWIGLACLALLALVSWTVRLSLRGSIVVRVQWDSDAKDEQFAILLSRNPKTPTVENPTLFRKKMEWIGKRKRHFEAWNIDQNTTFRGIPRGPWHVHLYGTYTRGRQILVLKEPPQVVEVQARKTAFVAHVLEAAEAEFKIGVVDDHGPVEGARVWLDEQRAKAAASSKDGSVTLKVPKGFHVIHVSARGMEVERPYHVVKAKVHEMTVNLVWEKRQEYVSRALERQVDDAEPYLTKSLHQPGPPTSIPLPSEETAGAAPEASGRHRSVPAVPDTIDIPLVDGPAAEAAAAIAPALPRPSSSNPRPRPSSAARATDELGRPATVAVASKAARPAIGKTSFSLKPLAPQSVPTPQGPSEAPAGDAVDLNMVPETDAPLDLPPVDLPAVDVPGLELATPSPSPKPRLPRR